VYLGHLALFCHHFEFFFSIVIIMYYYKSGCVFLALYTIKLSVFYHYHDIHIISLFITLDACRNFSIGTVRSRDWRADKCWLCTIAYTHPYISELTNRENCYYSMYTKCMWYAISPSPPSESRSIRKTSLLDWLYTGINTQSGST
jgi:hypothetical protein